MVTDPIRISGRPNQSFYIDLVNATQANGGQGSQEAQANSLNNQQPRTLPKKGMPFQRDSLLSENPQLTAMKALLDPSSVVGGKQSHYSRGNSFARVSGTTMASFLSGDPQKV